MARRDRRDRSSNVFGKPDTGYPEGSPDHPRIVETGTKRQQDTETGFLEEHPTQRGAYKTAYEDEPGDNHDKVVTEIFEALPGPWLYFTRYDLLLGPIQGKRRKVKAGSFVNGTFVPDSTLVAALTATTHTTYESRDGNQLVSWEIVETNGTGAGNDPAFPTTYEDAYDEVRGPIQRATQLVTATGSEVGSLTVTSILATLIRYEPYNQFLLRKITETWALPGPTITTSHYDPESGIKITEAKTLKRRSDITESNSVTTGVLTVVEIERTGIGAALGMEVVTVYPVATAVDSASAIVEEDDRPFQYVGRLNFNQPSKGLNIGDINVAGVGIEASTAIHNANPQAQLTKHTIRTWFINATTKPTLTFDEVQPRSIRFSDTNSTASFNNVLFDEFVLNFSGTNRTISATSPSFSTYYDSWIGNSKIVDGSVKELRRFRWKVVSVSVTMR